MSAAASLCDELLRDALARGVTALEFVGAGSVPVVNQQLEGLWQPYAQIPAPSFANVLRHLKVMAHLDHEQPQASGTIHMQHEGHEVAIALTFRRTTEGLEFVTLGFPANPVTS